MIERRHLEVNDSQVIGNTPVETQGMAVFVQNHCDVEVRISFLGSSDGEAYAAISSSRAGAAAAETHLVAPGGRAILAFGPIPDADAAKAYLKIKVERKIGTDTYVEGLQGVVGLDLFQFHKSI